MYLGRSPYFLETTVDLPYYQLEIQGPGDVLRYFSEKPELVRLPFNLLAEQGFSEGGIKERASSANRS